MIDKFNETNFSKTLTNYLSYRKCFGLLTAGMCDLPIVRKGFIIFGDIQDSDFLEFENEYRSPIMCRPDAEFNKWYRIPRGRDLRICEIPSFYRSIEKTTKKEGILLCLQHPSIYFTNSYVERWNITGGVNVLILWGDKIIIEYVGKGFDIGDISRGMITPHIHFSIPWKMINNSPDIIWNNIQMVKMSDQQYLLTRGSRITFLRNLGYKKELLDAKIPERLVQFSYEQFKCIYYDCIINIIEHHNLFLYQAPITVLINLYQNSFHVFEIWESNK